MTNKMMLKNEKTLVRRMAAYVREAVVGGVLAAPRLRRASASALDRPSIEPSAVAAGLATHVSRRISPPVRHNASPGCVGPRGAALIGDRSKLSRCWKASMRSL